MQKTVANEAVTADEPDEPDETDETVWTPPTAEDVTDNVLLNQFESLDELLDSLEDTENGEKDDSKNSEFRSKINWFFDFLEVFTVCMVCIILIFSFVARLTMVDGDSMNDTLLNGQYLVVTDLFYSPKAGDIVVLQNTSLSIELLRNPLVKRVIATGGQTVDISDDGTVTITDENGEKYVLDQSFTKDETYKKGAYHCYVPDGYVFVMGDNRNNSTDSRDSRVGLVDERCIFGKAVMRVLPISDFSLFKNPYSK